MTPTKAGGGRAKVLQIDPAAIFDRIRDNITKSFEHRQAALDDIVFVYEKRVWKQSHYASFEDCLEAELNIDRFPLSKEARREAVAFLDSAGLTTRAIAAALGISKMTAARDISTATNVAVENEEGVEEEAEDPKPTRKTGLDGRSRSTGGGGRSGDGGRSGGGAGGGRYGGSGRPLPKPEPPDCLTPKATNVLAAARDLGEYAMDVGKELVSLEFEDLTNFTFEELSTLQDHIYRARHGLKNCRAKLQE